METIILNENQIEEAINILKKGGTLAVPTDTVYGLACVFNNESAIEAVKKAKNRPNHKPLPMMVSEKSLINEYAYLNREEELIVDKLMPGPLTLVLRKKENIADFVTNGFDTIAIRIPEDGVMVEILKKIGIPLLVTSANLSGMEAVNTSDEVLKQLKGRIDGVIFGESDQRPASTIVSLTDGLKILRSGKISQEEIERIIGE